MKPFLIAAFAGLLACSAIAGTLPLLGAGPSATGGAPTCTAISGTPSTVLHLEGADASTTITDSAAAPRTWTVQNQAQIDTAQFKFGAAGLLLDGTGDAVKGDGNAAFTFGTGDFTLAMWVRTGKQASGVYMAILDFFPAADIGTYFSLYIAGDDTFRLYSDGGGGADKITGTTTQVINTWYHLEISRVSGTTRLFVNGTQEGSSYTDANNYSVPGSSTGPYLGADSGNGNALQGHIDDLLVIKGTGLHTGNFTAPTLTYCNS